MIPWVCSTHVQFGDEPWDFWQFVDSFPASPLSGISFLLSSSQGSFFQVSLFRKIGFSQSFLLSHCLAVPHDWGYFKSKEARKLRKKKKRGDTLHTFQTRGPFWTRELDSHLWLRSLLSCLDNTVLQLGWSLGRVRREKKREMEKKGRFPLQSSACRGPLVQSVA